MAKVEFTLEDDDVGYVELHVAVHSNNNQTRTAVGDLLLKIAKLVEDHNMKITRDN